MRILVSMVASGALAMMGGSPVVTGGGVILLLLMELSDDAELLLEVDLRLALSMR